VHVHTFGGTQSSNRTTQPANVIPQPVMLVLPVGGHLSPLGSGAAADYFGSVIRQLKNTFLANRFLASFSHKLKGRFWKRRKHLRPPLQNLPVENSRCKVMAYCMVSR
jgi:hypothetical protein